MSKVWIVFQNQYQESYFGDLCTDISKVIGVCSTEELANDLVNQAPIAEFEAQYGTGIEDCYIESFEVL